MKTTNPMASTNIPNVPKKSTVETFEDDDMACRRGIRYSVFLILLI
jgi:hypothetical protein